MKKIKKPWGSEEIIELNKKFCVKKILMKKKHRCSLQYHKKKIETNDLKATKIWCIVTIDEEGNVKTFDPDQIKDGIKYLEKAETLIGHNILGFDIPVIKNLYGVDLYHKKIIDTLVVSRLINPNKEKGHSLQNTTQ